MRSVQCAECSELCAVCSDSQIKHIEMTFRTALNFSIAWSTQQLLAIHKRLDPKRLAQQERAYSF